MSDSAKFENNCIVLHLSFVFINVAWHLEHLASEEP